MARKKLEIQASEDQLGRMYNAFKSGAPLSLALAAAGISLATYYYWLAVASIVVTAKSQQELEEIEKLAQSGVNIQQVRDMAMSQQESRKTALNGYVEPNEESLLRYKNNIKFRKYADQCYAIINECSRLRAEFATGQLNAIKLSTLKKNAINPSGAMWWLERNMPDQFAKPSDKVKEAEDKPGLVPSIEVEFIDPNTDDTKQRLLDIENQILHDMKGDGKA